MAAEPVLFAEQIGIKYWHQHFEEVSAQEDMQTESQSDSPSTYIVYFFQNQHGIKLTE